ncbi:MAG: hypothetical protein Kow0099_19920 [Candidatus Abyssubacteria bacterium]
MQELLGLGDTKKVRALAGLAGGIGHQGAACGILVGGAIALSLASATVDENQADITARGCAYADEYVRRFKSFAGSPSCADITGTDFSDDAHVRRYILKRARNCVRLASRAASEMVDIISRSDRPGERYYELNQKFSERNLHCATSTFLRAVEESGVDPVLPANMLIPLNGGIGYTGATCGALLGGCIFIGLQKGGDTSQSGALSIMYRYIVTLIQGAAAFHRRDLSPANDALLRCSELFAWFNDKFRSTACRIITQTDFHNAEQTGHFFRQTITRCASMAEETAKKAAELAR